MFSYLDPISEGLTDERKKEIVDQIAEKIVKRGLVAPAIILLESVKPFAKVGSYTFLLFSAPILSFIGLDGYEYTGFFKDKENIELLIRRIEELDRPKKD